MGLFSSNVEIEQIPLTPQQKKAREYMENLLFSGTPDIPTAGVAGMSAAEAQAQGILTNYLSAPPRGYEAGMDYLERTLAGEYDPRTSQFYGGLREQSRMEEAAAVADLRRGSQAGGMYYSEPSMRAEGELRARYGASRDVILGSLYESERNRMAGAVPQMMEYGQIPARQAAAGMTYGALPRQIDQAGEDARYNMLMQRIMFPYTQGTQMAGQLWGMKPDYYVSESPSTFSQLVGGAQAAVGMMGAIPSAAPAASMGPVETYGQFETGGWRQPPPW